MHPPSADIMIVGAGTAGSVLANRLSAWGNSRVLLLEAGGEAEDPRSADPAQWAMLQNSAVDWAFRASPPPGLGVLEIATALVPKTCLIIPVQTGTPVLGVSPMR